MKVKAAARYQDRYQVIQIDDEGSRVVVEDARTPSEAANRAAACDERINASTFVVTWNYACDGVRYELGLVEDVRS